MYWSHSKYEIFKMETWMFPVNSVLLYFTITVYIRVLKLDNLHIRLPLWSTIRFYVLLV